MFRHNFCNQGNNCLDIMLHVASKKALQLYDVFLLTAEPLIPPVAAADPPDDSCTDMLRAQNRIVNYKNQFPHQHMANVEREIY